RRNRNGAAARLDWLLMNGGLQQGQWRGRDAALALLAGEAGFPGKSEGSGAGGGAPAGQLWALGSHRWAEREEGFPSPTEMAFRRGTLWEDGPPRFSRSFPLEPAGLDGSAPSVFCGRLA
ncbi:hypothetical protein H1C71_012426, partial [Ictidomys tridecemlineatus]